MLKIPSIVVAALICGSLISGGENANKTSESPPSEVSAPAVSQDLPEPLPVIPTKAGEKGHIRTVCRLGSLAAKDTTSALYKLFKTEGKSIGESGQSTVVIVPEPFSNCLIISGTPAAVEEVRRLVADLDRPAAIVQLEVRLTDISDVKSEKSQDAIPAEIKKPDANASRETSPKKRSEKILVNAVLTTLDGKTVTAMIGGNQPYIANVNKTSFGRVNSIQWINVGTQIKLTPRLRPDGIVDLDVDIGDTCLGPLEEGAPIATLEKGEEVRQPSVDSLQIQTKLQLQDGKTMTISGMTRSGKARQIAVTAHIIRPGAEKTAERTE
jgi:type II secretory pathway component GspD/PulD (secretin)